jgi:hypothetical protein
MLRTMNCCKEVVDAHRAGALTLAASSQDRLARNRTPLSFGSRRGCGEESLPQPDSLRTIGIPHYVRNDQREKLVFFSYRAGKIHGRKQDEDVCLKQGNE